MNRNAAAILACMILGTAYAEIDATTDPNYPFRHLKVLGPVKTVTYNYAQDNPNDPANDTQLFIFNRAGKVGMIGANTENHITFEYRNGCFLRQTNVMVEGGRITVGDSFQDTTGANCQVLKTVARNNYSQITSVTHYVYKKAPSGVTHSIATSTYPGANVRLITTTLKNCSKTQCTTRVEMKNTNLDGTFTRINQEETITFRSQGIRKGRSFVSRTYRGDRTTPVESKTETSTYTKEGWLAATKVRMTGQTTLNLASSYAYAGKDRYGNWIKRIETPVHEGIKTTPITTTRTFTYF